jgi:hypothetical protein
MNLKTIIVGVVGVLLIVAAALFFMLGLHQEVTIVTQETEVPGFKLTPPDALKVATPYLEKHGTYDWNTERQLTTYVVVLRSWFGDRYYVKRTNYPFKTNHYLLSRAVIVHPQTGEVSFAKRLSK